MAIRPLFTAVALAIAFATLAAPVGATPAAAPTATPVAVTQVAWWSTLDDPVLAELVTRGLAANHDVAQARARIERARALAQGADWALLPTAGVGLHGSAAQASRSEAPGLERADRRSDRVSAGLDFSWEVDLFGRLRAQRSASHERAAASEFQLQAVRLAVSAEIANAWFALNGAREQLELARIAAGNRARTLEIVDARWRHGLASPLDEHRVRAEFETAAGEVPQHEAAARVATHRLAVLLGAPVAEFTAPAASNATAALVPVAPFVGLDLAQRPDLRAHEAELRAVQLDVASIRAELYPRFTLRGILGFVAGSVTALGSGGTLSWLAAPSLVAPVLDRPRIEARVAAAGAGQREALAAHAQRVLLATEEVENALVRHAKGWEHLQAQQRAAHHAAEAERIAAARYAAGAADLLELLDAQRTAQRVQAQLSVALTAQRQHLVAVFKGFGAPA